MNPFSNRRQVVQLGVSLAAVGLLPKALSQPAKPASGGLVVTQIADMSTGQVDVSKDFVTGSRIAWQDINAKGGLRGRRVQHVTLDVDGSAANLRVALTQALDNPGCVALSGTCSTSAAAVVSQILRIDNVRLAHVAPWLQHSLDDIDDNTFAIFADRQAQIHHALKSLATLGVSQLGVVYASAADESLHQRDVSRLAEGQKLGLQIFRASSDTRALGQSMSAATPAILLFIGGTPELARFIQGLENQARQRYVIGVSDIQLQTLAQMGAARHTPVIATQPVPMVNAQIPVVRHYRQVLNRLLDEPPTPQSLAGFAAARYTFEVLNSIEGPVTRASALAAFSRRQGHDLGGWRVSPLAPRQIDAFVTQSMLTRDGRVIG